MNQQASPSLSLSNPHPKGVNWQQKAALALFGIGLLILLFAWLGGQVWNPFQALLLALGLISGSAWWYARAEYGGKPAGIKNNAVMFRSLSNRGLWGWIAGVMISGFYICLYWYPETMKGLIEMFEAPSRALRGQAADQWFVYGSFYTLAVLLMGAKFIWKYRHNRYQVIRTVSVMFFQLIFSFLIPAFMQLMHQPEFYFTYFWPLKSEYLFPDKISYLTQKYTHLGVFLVFWGAVMSFIAVPVLTYFFGKRWYCSWVCGCGALAETAGDPFRTLSDKSLRAWRIERWLIHSVLVFIVLTTLLAWLNSWQQGAILGDLSQGFSKTYGFLIGSIFSGVIGTGFYPILGSRGWCRFGCPQAAILGIFQKYFSRFRITVNGGQCISCGNCSTYCEMGIDVKAYAQRGQDVVRASCVGCGICSAVCPRGVLRLENGADDVRERAQDARAFHIGEDGVKLNDH
ncbi:MAG: 4Fe-4S binding protein [Chitinophagales bacterium]|nr:4Fe-4S binding protein [Chitinophagales bacterium]